MAVRLAFAVQAHVKPDLLVVDEALAVGDEMFQKKCYTHLEKLKSEGTSILLVTHSCPQILQHCNQAILLSGGELKLWGEPKSVTETYQRLNNAPPEDWESVLTQAKHNNKEKEGKQLKGEAQQSEKSGYDPNLIPNSGMNYKARGIRIEKVEVLNQNGQPANLIPNSQTFSLRFYYEAERKLDDLKLACNIANQTGIRITGQQYTGPDCCEGDRFTVTFHFSKGLLPGLYFVGGGIWIGNNRGDFLHRVVDTCAIRIIAETKQESFGLCDLRARIPTLG